MKTRSGLSNIAAKIFIESRLFDHYNIWVESHPRTIKKKLGAILLSNQPRKTVFHIYTYSRNNWPHPLVAMFLTDQNNLNKLGRGSTVRNFIPNHFHSGRASISFRQEVF